MRAETEKSRTSLAPCYDHTFPPIRSVMSFNLQTSKTSFEEDNMLLLNVKNSLGPSSYMNLSEGKTNYCSYTSFISSPSTSEKRQVSLPVFPLISSSQLAGNFFFSLSLPCLPILSSPPLWHSFTSVIAIGLDFELSANTNFICWLKLLGGEVIRQATGLKSCFFELFVKRLMMAH